MTIRKNLFLLAILVFSGCSFAQTKAASKDTVFLLSETKWGAYHSVYIDPDKSSKVYDWIVSFKFDKTEKKYYQKTIDDLKSKPPGAFVRHQLYDLPRQWCLLYTYKSNYYLYSPCDYIGNYRAAISDTTYIDYYGDGTIPSRINSLKKVDDFTYKIVKTDYSEKPETIIIHLIDKKRGIAVFELPGEKYPYSLMVSVHTARTFPVIVHSCETQKQTEYDFPKPDFIKLIKTKGKK